MTQADEEPDDSIVVIHNLHSDNSIGHEKTL